MKNKFITAIVIASTTLYTVSCEESNKTKISANSEDSMLLKENDEASSGLRSATEWESIDLTAPVVKYDEVKGEGIEIRDNANFTLYGQDENVLFESGSANLKTTARKNLDEIVESINNRNSGKEIRVYGYTDSTASKELNMQLSEDRAEAVKKYLTETGKLSADKISVHPKGEKNPVATNATAEGRQENRRVVIAVKKADS